MSRVTLVSPVYNNALSLPDLLTRFQALAARNPADQFQFLFVDDGSFDDSFAVLEGLAGREPRLKIVKLARNFGSNAALLAGIGAAEGEVVAAIAADLQDPPELIHDMLAEWRAGAKVVLAARAGRDDGWLTNLLSDTFYALFRRYAIRTMPPHGFDFFLLDRQVADLINGIQENNAYLMGLILWLGFQPKVLTYQRQARPARYGRSMWTFAKKIKYFIDSFVSFSYVPVRASSLLGIGLSVVGLAYAAVLIFLRLAYEIKVEGWTTLMVVLLIVSGAQMMMLGVLGEYLWRNLDETRRRPRYVIERTVSAAPPANPQPAAAAAPAEAQPAAERPAHE